MNKSKSCYSGKTNKTNKTLIRLIMREKER